MEDCGKLWRKVGESGELGEWNIWDFGTVRAVGRWGK